MAAAAPTTTPDNNALSSLEITVLRANGVLDTLTFPADAQTFWLGGQMWIGFEDADGNSYDYILTTDPGDRVLSMGPGVAEPAFGPTPIPNATAPPPGPGGGAPTPGSNDPAELADDIADERGW